MQKRTRKPDKPLSQEAVEDLKPEPSRYEVPDPGCPGLWIVVQPTGRKSWVFRYSLAGGRGRVLIGHFPAMTVKEARGKAHAYSSQVVNKVDPATVKRKAKTERMTVAKLAAQFEEEHVATLRPRTQKGYKHYIKHFIVPELGRLQVKEVGLAEAKAVQKRGLKLSNRTSNYAIAVLSKMLAWAEEEGIREPGTNPCQAVTRKPEKVKQRFLTEAEIQRVWDALETLQGEGAALNLDPRHGKKLVKLQELPAAAVKLLLLTGCRYSEVLGLRWDQIALRDEQGNAVAVLKEHKTMARGDRLVVLNPEAYEVIKNLPKHKLSPLVFAGRGKDGSIGDSLRHAWLAVRTLAGLPDVRPHDLRHTFASVAIARGLTLEQTGQLLGHSAPATTKRYAHLVEEAARENLAKVTPGLARRKKA